MKINKLEKLGNGADGEVFMINLNDSDKYYATKTRKIYNNKNLAFQTFQQMHHEFHIA